MGLRSPFQEGITLPPQALAALQNAPKRPPGTEVTIEGKPVRVLGVRLDALNPLGPPIEHMFETYDDGRQQFIHRGEPQGGYLHGRVDPARQSPDYGQGERVLFRRFLPNVSAADAIKSAQADDAEVNRSKIPYGLIATNSNSLMSDHTLKRYGKRVGDDATPGWTDSLSRPSDSQLRAFPVWAPAFPTPAPE
jgi:hypothetical protein